MFCPKCGKGEQPPDSYCRSCGDFLDDAANSTSLMTRILGISNPEKQVKFTLTIDLVTAIVSGFLLFFLMGYFDGATCEDWRSDSANCLPGLYFPGIRFGVAVVEFHSGYRLSKKIDCCKENCTHTRSIRCARISTTCGRKGRRRKFHNRTDDSKS